MKRIADKLDDNMARSKEAQGKCARCAKQDAENSNGSG